jgi:hypothetical protein
MLEFKQTTRTSIILHYQLVATGNHNIIYIVIIGGTDLGKQCASNNDKECLTKFK